MYIHSVYKNQSMKAILSKLREKIKSNCELVKVKKGCTKWSPIIKRRIWDFANMYNWSLSLREFFLRLFSGSSSLQCFDEFFYKKWYEYCQMKWAKPPPPVCWLSISCTLHTSFQKNTSFTQKKIRQNTVLTWRLR